MASSWSWIKVLYALAILVAGLASAVIATISKKWCDCNVCPVLGYLNIFGGGVLLAGGFVHLLNDAIISYAQIDEGDLGFPWMSVSCSFAIWFFISLETTVNWVTEHRVRLRACCTKAELNMPPPLGAPLSEADCSESAATEYGAACQDPEHQHHHDHQHDHQHEHDHHHDDDTSGSIIVEAKLQGKQHEDHDHGHHLASTFETHSILTAVMLSIALSSHSFLAGFDLGVSTEEDGVSVLIAILAHKTVAGIALAGAFLEVEKIAATKYWWGFWTLMVGWALTTPIGVLFGMIVAEAMNERGKAVCIALTAGMFLYVSLIEIVPHELEKKERWMGSRLLKLLTFFAGWGFMSLLALWV